MLDLAKSPADRQALMLLFGRTEYGRPYFLPPDVPAERVQALRRAFDATMKDEGFIADAVKIGFEVDPLSGEQVQASVAALAHTPPEVVARVRAALNAMKFPLPLVGRGRGEVARGNKIVEGRTSIFRRLCITSRPPPLTPPHKGEGNRKR